MAGKAGVMRIRLKGINSIRKRLADGSFRTYHYAWKGGPPLRGEPGTPEFIASYNEAVVTRAATPQGTLLSVLQSYQASGEFLGRAERTRSDYVKQIKIIEMEYADFPLAALADRRTRGVFKAWRDKLAAKSRRQADYGWQVLALVLSWALDRGLVPANPCARGGRPCGHAGPHFRMGAQALADRLARFGGVEGKAALHIGCNRALGHRLGPEARGQSDDEDGGRDHYHPRCEEQRKSSG
jgi:hypothetical protein